MVKVRSIRALGERCSARAVCKIPQGRIAEVSGYHGQSVWRHPKRDAQPIYIHALVRIARQLETPVQN